MSVESNAGKRDIRIALAGNPNSGKTSLFNQLTGSRQRVANWPGVTVERKEGVVERFGRTFRVVDLPGIYSLSASSEDEIIARDFLVGGGADVIVNVVDASNLERNLYLTTQLLELGIGVVVALNMIDIAMREGIDVDCERLATLLQARVVVTQASKGQGIDEILRQAMEVAECPVCEPPRSAWHGPEIESEVAKLEKRFPVPVEGLVPLRWYIIKAIEGDSEAERRLEEASGGQFNVRAEVEKTRRHLEQVFGDDVDAIIADGRYGFIGGLLREAVKRSPKPARSSTTDRVDNIVLHRIFGIPIFLFLMWLTFAITFDVGDYLVGYLETAAGLLASFVESAMPPGPFSSLLVKGIIGGVGGVVVFVPNIALMFLMISVLEDSGYMARAAFLMDRAMHTLGLHGKSFIPMLMGFGCNVPAIMATRTLQSREDRLITILITPFMSCSARLPIYVLFASVFFPRHGEWVIFSLYALGVLLAVLSAKLLRRTLFSRAVSPFVMELPPYRVPTLRGLAIHVWERTWLFLSKAGTVILAAAVLVWALSSLPGGVQFGGEESAAGCLGRALGPVLRPLGIEWPAGLALFFGLAAKEIVVSTLGVLYGEGNLRSALAGAFTPLSAYVFMVVSLIYIPCAATMAAIRRETASWSWMLFSTAYSLTLAYVVGFIIFRLGILLGLR